MKLNTASIKTFFLHHTEKVVLGIFCCVSAWILMGTNWTHYPKSPVELEKIVEKKDEQIEAAEWPAAKKQKLQEVLQDDIIPKVDSIIKGELDVEGKEYLVKFYPPPGGDVKPARQPVVFPIENLIATAGTATLTFNKEAELLPGMISEDEAVPGSTPEGTEGEKPRNPFAPRIPAGGGLDGEPGSPEMTEPGQELGGDPLLDEEPGDGMGEGNGGAMPSNVEAHATHFVSVVGVIPRQRQLLEIADALNLSSPEQAEPYLDFLGFELERKTTNEKGAQWKSVSLQSAGEMLSKATDFGPDPVSITVQHPETSLMLPARLFGDWGSEVTHPRLENFSLTDKQMQMEIRLNLESLKKHSTEQRKRQGSVSKRKGLGDLQQDSRRAIKENLENASQAELMELMGKIQDVPKGMAPAEEKKLLEKLANEIKSRVTASGHLILFRFIDFDVEPGKSYQYRAKLVLYNPNYGRSVAEVRSESITTKEELITNWSNISNVTAVDETTKTFVANVPAPFREYDAAYSEFDLFQWNPETGLFVNDPKVKTYIGNFIGKPSKVHVVKPVEGTYEKEDYTFKTSKLLLDVEPVFRSPDKFHPDLVLNDNKGTAKSLGIIPETILFNEKGQLVVKSATMEAAKHKAAKGLQSLLDEAWLPFKDRIADGLKMKEDSEGDPFGDDPTSIDEGMAPDEGLRRIPNKKRGKSRAMLKRKRSSRRNNDSSRE